MSFLGPHPEYFGLLNPNETDPEGKTILNFTVKREKIVERLLMFGADPNRASKGGLTPLHAAAIVGKEESVRILLDHGADFGLKDRNGLAPLAVAAMSGHLG